MEKDRENRYQNTKNVLADLEREKGDSGSNVTVIRQKSNTKQAITIAAAFTLLALVVAFLGINTLWDKPEKLIPASHRQLTFEGNVALEFGGRHALSAISPDGQFIAYVLPKDSLKSIVVQDISGGKAIEIYSGKIDEISSLSWAPNGSKILCSLWQKGKLESLIIPRLGGQPRQFPHRPYISWSSDGTQIAGAWSTTYIRLFDEATGDSVGEIKWQREFEFLVDLDWSHAGDRFAILTSRDGHNVYEIWTINKDGDEVQKVMMHEGTLYSPRWSANGEAIYFLRKGNGGQDLMKVEISKHDGSARSTPKVLQTGLQAIGFSLARDNRKLIYTRSQLYSNLWMASLDPQYPEKSLKTYPLTRGTSSPGWPSFFPNAEKIVFVSQGNVHVMQKDGSNVEQLIFFDSNCSSPQWSPDSKKIAFINRGKVLCINTDGTNLRIFENTQVSTHLTWAPGERILYQRPGNRNFHFLDADTEMETPLLADDTKGWIFSPVYSNDGNHVAVHWNIKGSKAGIWHISLEDQSKRLLQEGLLLPYQWSNDGRWIYAVASENLAEVLKVPVDGGQPTIHATLPDGEKHSIGDISPDGKNIIYHNSEQSISDVWLMENFDPDVK